MRSPALAIAWEFRRRHRWGLTAVAGYLLALGIIRLVLEPGQEFPLDVSWSQPGIPEAFVATVIGPLTLAFLYGVAMFTYGFTGDLTARQSMYPARMFTLPVSSAALAGWPMLYGTVAMAGLWLAARRLALWPSGVDVPLIWPAVFVAVFLAWAQVLTWMPYGLSGLRVVIAVLWLVATDTVAVLALHFKPPEWLMVALLAPQLPLAYLAGRTGVARARRGEVPDWRGIFARLGRLADLRPSQQGQFASPAGAHAWFEWREHGWSLPAWVGILLPFELALLLVPGDDALVVYTVFGVLLTPWLMAAFVGRSARPSSQSRSESHGLPPFVATRPMSSAALIVAKLRTAIWSTLAAWLLVLVAIPVALTLSDTWPVVTERARRVSDVIGTPRAVVFLLLVIAGLVVSTWKQLVQNLYVGLSGRGWVIKASVSLTLTLLIFIEPVAQWVHANNAVQAALWDSLRWIPAVLVGIKMSAAASVGVRLYASRVLSDRTLVTGAACWCVAVFALYGVLVWLVWAPQMPRYWLMLLAILAMPLARVSAAPLALAWNRHR